MAKQRSRRMRSHQRIDLLSGLPEPIFHHIMSFLPAKDVARIPVLSKQFKQLWSSFPIIVFDQKSFSKINRRRSSSKVILDSDKFLDYVKNSIYLRRLDNDLRIFRLKLDLKGVDSDSRVDEIIGFALENNVQELDLEIKVKKEGTSGVHVVEIAIVNNEPQFNLNENIVDNVPLSYKLMDGFSSRSLTKLKLNGLRFDINELISSCPLVKSLILTCCLISENQSINKASYRSLTMLSFNRVNITDKWIEEHVSMFLNLKNLALSCCNKLRNVRVMNENLERLEIVDSSLVLKNIAFLVPKLRSLHLGENSFANEKWLKEQVSSLSFLENLKLQNCSRLEKIEIISDGLQSLELLDLRKLVEVSIDATNLVSFIFSGNICAFRLINSPRLLNPKLRYLKKNNSQNAENYAWNLLRDSLSLFSHCEALTLECQSNKDLIFPKDVRDDRLPVLCDVKHLKIINRSWKMINEELIDNFLWILLHPETLCLVPASGREKIVKFHYGKNIERENICCRGLPLRCWRDDVKKVELQNFEDDVDDKDNLLAYFGQIAIFLD